MKICFDSEKYERLQSKQILDRVQKFNGRVYLEFGGKLFDDMHASRVLPGFRPDSKVRILQKIANKAEIIMVVGAPDIERKKIRADYNLTYDDEVLRQISKLREYGLLVSNIVITLYSGQKSADSFIQKLKARGENVYIHTPTKGYPNDVETIVSKQGYGANPYIKVSKPVVVVTAPGPNSGKMSTCLSQMYHESEMGINSGYAKFETFPIWNLPVDHPINLAYMAATADIKDKNLVDIYHLQKYKTRVTNYNRDIESFAILKQILTKITGNAEIYNSPTDMGVNMAGFAITDEKGCIDASYNEIIRRYFKALCDAKQGNDQDSTAQTILRIIKKHGIDINRRRVIAAANRKYEQSNLPSVAIELDNTSIVCGRQTELLTAASSAVLNCLKEMANIEDKVMLLDEKILKKVCEYKDILKSQKNSHLDLYDTLCTLSICSSFDQNAALSFSMLGNLKLADAHSSHMLPSADQKTLKSLQINFSSEPKYRKEYTV